MSNALMDQLRAELADTLKPAQEIAAKAADEKRDLTTDEKTTVLEVISKANGVKARIDKFKSSGDLQAKADADFTAKMAALDDPDAPALTEATVAARKAGGALTADRSGTSSAWAKSVAVQMQATARSSGVKALTTGSIDVPSPVQVDVVANPQRARVVDLLVNRQKLDGNSFEFLRQTVRTSNAAPVADGGTKPTSVFTVAPIEDRARVIAHLSEPFPERFFADYNNLVRFLDDEMREGVLQALETEIVSGDGTGEHMTGIFNVSGSTVVPWSTNLFTTIRKARTAMQVLNERPNAWVMHPSDLELVDLTVDSSGRYYLTGGGGDAAVDALFGGLPRIPSTAVPAGTALLGDFTQATLYVREDVRLDADRSGTLFDKNQVKLRAEGRFGFAVLRPQAFAEVDLTAA